MESETKKSEPPKMKGEIGWTGYMDGFLKTNLAACQKAIKQDWDMICIVSGAEGAGKSVLAQQCAKHVDPDFNIERVCFNPKEFISSINKAKKFQAIVYDEAYGGMSSRAAMSEVNRSLMGVLAEIRQKNLWVFIVLPSFFELDKYAAIHRSRFLLHVYAKDFKRGRFSFYSFDRKKLLYVLGKKYYSMSKPRPNFIGRFVKGYTVDEEEYRQKKLDALKAREEKKDERMTARHIKYMEQRDIIIRRAYQNGIKVKDISQWISIDTKQIYNIINKPKIEGGSPPGV